LFSFFTALEIIFVENHCSLDMLNFFIDILGFILKFDILGTLDTDQLDVILSYLTLLLFDNFVSLIHENIHKVINFLVFELLISFL